MWLALLFLMALVGCGGRSTRPTAELCRQGRAPLRSERYVALLAQADADLRHVAFGSRCYWQLRLLRAETLIEQRESEKAGQALDFELPSGSQWTEEWARYRLCQANVERLKGDLGAALQRLDEARRLAIGIGASDLLAEIEFRRALVALYQHKLDDAGAGFRHVRDDAARRGDPYLRMKGVLNMGLLLSDYAYRYEDAITWDEEALQLAQALGATNDEALAKLRLGWCYYRLLDRDKAQRYFQEASGGLELTGDRHDDVVCLGDMAAILLDEHQYQAAAKTYNRALEKARALNDLWNQASALNNLAEIAIETGEWSTAERYNNEAWDKWKHDEHWRYYSMVKAGKIATGRNDFAKADELFRSVIREKGGGDPEPLLRAHSGRAFMLAKEGKIGDAEAEYRATDTTLERQRTAFSKAEYKVSYFGGQIDFYQEYVDFVMARGRTYDALAIAESSRARALLDRLRVAHARKASGTAASFQQIAATSGSVLLSYWVAPERSYLWVITGSGVKVFTLPAESRIREMVKAYDDFIQVPRDPLNTDNLTGRQLYDTLIAPAAALMPKNAKVIIVPDGPLYALNFETLPVTGGKPRYWIEDVTVTVTPSLDLLVPDRGSRNPTPPSLLLIGNPVSPVPSQYPELEFAAQEIEGIRKDLPSFRQKVWEREQAEPAVYARSMPAEFGYIHFVAHGVANSEEPLESAVILSRSSNGSEYKLRARDVLGMPLHATLVTISACRSAGARVYAGEGLVGFPWAFLEAGAQNVIAGLWDVNDRSTADLMSRLYARIAHGADPATSLREAKLAVIHSGGAWQKPYYWGPFELFTRQSQ